MTDLTPPPNGHTRWIAVAAILMLGAAFTGAYNFFGTFATKTEVATIREEQQRRTATVYAVPQRLEEFERAIELMRIDLKQLELTVAELRATILQARGGR